jgi:hypothetical protein
MFFWDGEKPSEFFTSLISVDSGKQKSGYEIIPLFCFPDRAISPSSVS